MEIFELKLGDYFAVQRTLEPKHKHMESSLSQGKSQGKSQAELQGIYRLDYHSVSHASSSNKALMPRVHNQCTIGAWMVHHEVTRRWSKVPGNAVGWGV